LRETAGSPSAPVTTVSSAETPLQPAEHVHGAPSVKEDGLATEHSHAASNAGSSRHRHGC
jgi:hypothetical protein